MMARADWTRGLRGAWWMAVAMVAALAMGCVSSHKVKLGDGSVAYDVDCFSGRSSCTSEAQRLCHGRPYVVLNESATLGMATQDRQGSLRIQCSDEFAASLRADAPDTSPVKESDIVVCKRAYGDAARSAAMWSGARGHEVRDPLPAPAEFMSTCTSLPPRAQLCLNVVYRDRHGALCEKTMETLADEVKAKLDTLFLIAPGKAARPAVPGEIQL